MAATNDGRAVEGGPAQPVYITNATGDGVPTTATIIGPLGSAALAQSVATNDTSATLYAGTLTTSTSAAALAASQAVREVLVQNDPDNSADVLIGTSSAQTIQLRPGQSIVIPVANLATVYAKSVSGTPTINYLGRS